MLEFLVTIKEEDLDKIRKFFEQWVDDWEFDDHKDLIRELFYLYDERDGNCLDIRNDVRVKLSREDVPTYKIVRNYFRNRRKRTIKHGLILEEAQTHCGNSETSSKTCTSAKGKRRTRQVGSWFDSYVREG